MPATSEKQRRYMGARLAEQRETGRNSTGMSERQLSDFASDVKSSHKKKEVHGQSIHDIESFETRRSMGSTRARITDENQKFANPSGNPQMGETIPVKFLGTDTTYDVMELDMNSYGKDWNPTPYQDYFEEPGGCATFREMEQYEYDQCQRPGEWKDRYEDQVKQNRDSNDAVAQHAKDEGKPSAPEYVVDPIDEYGVKPRVYRK